MSTAEAATRLEDLLVEHLARWARANWPKEDVYAFGLVFSPGWPPIPAPALGTVEEREAWLAEPDEDGAGLMIWNPAECATYDPDFCLSVPSEAEDAAETLKRAWTVAEDDDAWVEFMGRVAARLAREDWGDLPRSKDFVVFASTAEIEEQAELEGHLAHSVPPDVLDQLRERGMLHVAPLEDL